MVLCQRATSMDYRKKSEEWVYVLLSLSDMHRYSLLVDVLGLYLTCEIESWFYLLTIFLISIFTGKFAHCRFIWGYWKWSGRFLVQRQTKKNNFTRRKSGYKLTHHSQTSLVIFLTIHYSGREIAPNTGANVTKFFTLVTKSWKLVAKLAVLFVFWIGYYFEEFRSQVAIEKKN